MLTKEEILSKYKVKSLEDIKNINLWGCDLTNIDIISEMKNVEVVSLSLNKISTLKPFENLQHLKELYLRKNDISNIKEIDYLKKCINLKILWIEENPLCEKNPNYQKEIIKELPQIIKLDNKSVKDILNEEDKKIEEKEEEKKEEEKKEVEKKEEEKKEEEKKIEEEKKEEEEKKQENDLLNEMNNDLVNLKTTNLNKEVPVDKSIDNNLIQQILNQKNIDSTLIPNINPNHIPNLNTNINQIPDNTLVNNILKDIDTSSTFINKNKDKDNTLVNNILKDVDTSSTFINKNKDKDNTLVNNILKDVDTSQTMLNKKDGKDKELENILNDIDTSSIFNKELPSIIKEEEQYPKNLDTIEQIRNYFNAPIHQPQNKKYDINMSNTLFASNNKPPTPFDGRNPYRRPPSEEQYYYNNYINYRDQNRNKGNYYNRNYHFQNTHKIKAVLNLIEILSPTDLIHLRNDIIKRLRNQDY